MPSKAERVLAALAEALAAACPAARVERNTATPTRVPEDGLIIVRDGEPGEPEQVLGGFSACTYEHAVPVEITVQAADATERQSAYDDLLMTIGAALAADPTLGGLAEGLTYGRPETLAEHIEGAAPITAGELTVVITYDTPSPLG